MQVVERALSLVIVSTIWPALRNVVVCVRPCVAVALADVARQSGYKNMQIWPRPAPVGLFIFKQLLYDPKIRPYMLKIVQTFATQH